MNSSEHIAAKRYAAAYDRLSHTEQEAVRRAEDLAVAAKAIEAVQKVLADPQISLMQKKVALQEALKPLPQVASFITVLLEAKRYHLLPEIVKQVEALLDVRRAMLRARVQSAQALSLEQQHKTQQALQARYGKQVEVVFETDEKLLGGLKIWCNGELLDGSWQGQFARLQEELIK